jgi:hypothetical protein
MVKSITRMFIYFCLIMNKKKMKKKDEVHKAYKLN